MSQAAKGPGKGKLAQLANRKKQEEKARHPPLQTYMDRDGKVTIITDPKEAEVMERENLAKVLSLLGTLSEYSLSQVFAHVKTLLKPANLAVIDARREVLPSKAPRSSGSGKPQGTSSGPKDKRDGKGTTNVVNNPEVAKLAENWPTILELIAKQKALYVALETRPLRKMPGPFPRLMPSRSTKVLVPLKSFER